MTNAEKFKEVFGFGVCSQTECNDCPLHDVSSGESVCNDDDFWQSEYKGEPTIPLPVIEKIKANIDKLPDLNPDYPMDMTTHVSKWAVFEIIDKAVKEITQ